MDHSIPETLDIPLDLSPPPSLNIPLWRSLFRNFNDRFRPEVPPPLHVTSEPVDVGMLLGDVVDLPWFRTVFTNLGDVISPETLPPLQLESRPVDVGELLSDQMAHPWWSSLLRNLADNVSPERLPALTLTSTPVKPEQASESLNVPRWSHLIDTPKVFYPDKPTSPTRLVLRTSRPAAVPKQPIKEDDAMRALTLQKKRELRRAHIREAIWVSLAAVEVTVLVVVHFFVH